MVGNQQANIQELCLELEEERNASSSAANEAMSMILRLQREKAEVQMEARQFKRFAEEKMSHDGQEIASLEEAIYKKEQAMQSLTCEIQAYKHRMMSFGFTESEAEGVKSAAGYSRNASFSSDMAGLVDSPTSIYPQLRCNLHESQAQSELEEDVMDIEKYPFGETPTKAQDLRNLEFRINQLERSPRADSINGDFGSKHILEKVIVGHSPRRHSRFSTDTTSSPLGGPDYMMDSPRWGTSFKKLDCVVEELKRTDSASEFEDDMSDRVYTIDSVHPGVPYNNFSEPKVAAKLCDEYVCSPMGSQTHTDATDPEVKKLYLRLQALEADRESMRQAILSMQTDKAQVALLREIAQELCKDMTPATYMTVQKQSNTSTFSITAVFKWIGSFVFGKKKASRSKSLEDLSKSNPGLLMILDKSPRTKLWRCVLSTQVPG